MVRGASAEALAELAGRIGSAGTLAEKATLGEELFGVARILRSDAALRRVVTDNSVGADPKAGLVKDVFGSAVGGPTLELLVDAVGRRWTMSTDLPAALEELAVRSTVAAAGRHGTTVGDELFAVRRLVDTNPGLRSALSDQTRSGSDRAALLLGLLAGKVTDQTALLVREAVDQPGRGLDTTLELYLELAAAALDQLVATVHTARELTEEERERLVAALRTQYDSEVQLHVVVDPDLLGGLRVQIRDDVIDGTVATRLDEARRRLAG